MNTLRKAQLKESWLILNKDDISDQIYTLNIDTLLKMWREKIDNYVNSKVKNLSIEELNGLRYKIEQFFWMKFDNKISFTKNLFSLLVQWVLIPNYIWDRQQEDIDKELDRILWSIIHKVDLIISENWFFGVNLGSEHDFLNELNLTWAIHYKRFNIWWIFWACEFDLNRDNWTYESNFYIKLTKTIEIDDWSHTKLDRKETANYNKIIKELSAYYWKPKDGEFIIKKWKYDGFIINVSKLVDSARMYWEHENDVYCLIKIYNPDLQDNLEPRELKKLYKLLIELNNFVVNFLWTIVGHKWGKHFYSFSSSSLLYAEDMLTKSVEDKEWEKLKEKFKSLLVKMKTPVYFDEIGWQDEAKEELKLIIKTFKHEQIIKSWWTKNTSGVIFEWPTWTGKTLLAKALANEIDAEVYLIKLTDVMKNAFINTWANIISDLFKFLRLKARQENKKIIIILDELDALFKNRNDSNQSGEDKKVVNTFLIEMWWFEDLQNVVFIWTTNNLESIDKAVIRSWRMSLQIKIDIPNKKWIEEIYKIYIEKAKKATERKIFADDIDMTKLTSLSKWFNWADIEEAIRMTLQMKAIEEAEWALRETLIIKTEDIISAINKIKSRGKKKTVKMGFWD